MVLASSDQVGSTNVADLASWSGKRSGRSKRWKTGWDFRPRDPAGNRWNCIHGTKWAPNSKLQEEKRKTTQVQDGQTKKKKWLYFLRSFEFFWVFGCISGRGFSGFAPRTAPAIKPVRARGEWNFTGESGDTPDPGEYCGAPWRAGQWAPETSRNNGWDLEKRWDILWYTY